MFVLNQTMKALQNSNDQYLGVILAAAALICICFLVYAIVKSWR